MSFKTLFLDRDGIINERIIDGYVTNLNQFIFRPDFLNSLSLLARLFDKVFVVSNQQGIGKGIMTTKFVDLLHQNMCQELKKRAFFIEKVYYCPHLATDHCECRKPKIGLARQAKVDFPEIDFSQSLMIGDSESDILFGKNCDMKTALISDTLSHSTLLLPDYHFNSIFELAKKFAIKKFRS
ncbi:MAG: HAD-IIIA family hydrolase [Bacteroidales bacterium]|jgi:D-glycero-D-manno-heptose 1,7-bisphosphate phosphatase|nr:HAD-IIIA family hydrolase [Bacteroidales bacterium]